MSLEPLETSDGLCSLFPVPCSHPLFSSLINPQPESTHVLADSQENHKYFVCGRINDDKIGAPNAGVFFDVMEVIRYHNTALKDMISKQRRFCKLLF
jgi:hypothetical protein